MQVIFTPDFEEGSYEGDGGLFRVHPSPDTYAQAVITFVREFGWQRFSVLTKGGQFFEQVYQNTIVS